MPKIIDFAEIGNQKAGLCLSKNIESTYLSLREMNKSIGVILWTILIFTTQHKSFSEKIV